MKLSKCKNPGCGAEYEKKQPFQKWCGVDCGLYLAKIALNKKKLAEKKADNKRTKEKLDAMNGKPELTKKAQAAFNFFIRARDVDMPCISCGRPLGPGPNTFDAGHYRSIGSAVHMRFCEDNAHGQCKRCNRYLGGNHVEYRRGLVARLGLERVVLIEADNVTRKYTHDGLREIARQYRAKAREALKQRADVSTERVAAEHAQEGDSHGIF